MVAGLFGDFLLFDLKHLDLALTVILLVDSCGAGVPPVIPGLTKVECEASVNSEVGVEFLGDTILHTGLMVEVGLIEKSPGLKVKRDSLLGVEELAVLKFGMTAPEVV